MGAQERLLEVGDPKNWASKATVDEWVAKDPRVDGHVVLLERESDPYTDDPDPFAFVDGDDVRCPETGTVDAPSTDGGREPVDGGPPPS